MKKELLLINPWIYDFSAYDLWSKPLGLLYLASFLRTFGFKPHFIDCLQKEKGTPGTRKFGSGPYRREIIEKPALLNHIPRRYARYGITEEAFVEQLLQNKRADAVLVTSIMTYWYPGVRRVVQLVRKYLPGTPVILGGIYASLLPDHARQTIQPDYLITGPGEMKALRLLSELFDFKTDDRHLPVTLDDYPYPAFDLIKNLQYLIVMTERGCPYDCSFCAQKKIAMPYTRRVPKKVVEEFKDRYRTFRLRDFAFYDDALFIHKEEHIQPILEGLIRTQLPLRLHSPNGLFARYVDKELAELMYKSNFKTIRISFETSNEARRKDMYSKVSNEDMIRAVGHLTAAGYRPKDLEAYVLMGLPEQTVSEVIASILFVHTLGVRVSLASFSPIHGTREFDKAVQAGLIPADIDPLLTNKSIFPLSGPHFSYETFRKIRTFAQILNEAAQRGLSLFTDEFIGTEVRQIVRRMTSE